MGIEPSAQELFRTGHLREARLSAMRTLDERRADPRLLKLVGDLSLYENRPEDAVHHLQLAMEQRRPWPRNLAIKAQLGMAHYRMDGFPDAAEQFADAAGPLPVGSLAGLDGIARQLAAFGDTVPYRIQGPDETRLELVATDPLPVVELSVNAGPPALFLIDTGGAELVLDSNFAAEAGAELAGTLRGEYAGRRRARTGLGRVGSVQAGALRIDDVPVHTLDLGALPDFFGIGIRGILGTRFLMHFLSTIDYPGGGLILRRLPGRLAQNRDAQQIPFWLVETHLILVRGRLNELPPTLLWVDTGLAGRGLLADAFFRPYAMTLDFTRMRLVLEPRSGGSG